jgi:MinD-like ATPase involved in chromosome partitioning or flagellar assembly
MANPAERPGEVITFYSYKGGTGRSMALANVAVLLAGRMRSSAKGVLMVDWDLEAPGLHRYFPEDADDDVEMVGETRLGLIDLFRALHTATEGQSSGDACENIVEEFLAKLDLNKYVRETSSEGLFLLPAGGFGASYSAHVNGFRWDELYARCPGLFRLLAERLALRYAYVLIDSRTGITDISGICTALMPNKLVAVFTPNRQSLVGALDQARLATGYRRKSEDMRPLTVFPLVSRIEPARPLLRDNWRYGQKDPDLPGYQPLFEQLFQEVYSLQSCSLDAYFDDVLIPHVADYAYGEEVAVKVERSRDRLSLYQSYDSLTRRLARLNAPWESLQGDESASKIPRTRSPWVGWTESAVTGGLLFAAVVATQLADSWPREARALCFAAVSVLSGLFVFSLTSEARLVMKVTRSSALNIAVRAAIGAGAFGLVLLWLLKPSTLEQTDSRKLKDDLADAKTQQLQLQKAVDKLDGNTQQQLTALSRRLEASEKSDQLYRSEIADLTKKLDVLSRSLLKADPPGIQVPAPEAPKKEAKSRPGA